MKKDGHFLNLIQMSKISHSLKFYQWIGKNIFHWGKLNKPTGNSVHATESLAKSLWKYITTLYI